MGEAVHTTDSSYSLRSSARPRMYNRKTLWLVAAFAVLTWSILQTGILSQDLINTAGWPTAARFFNAVLHPDFSGDFLRLTLNAALTTLAFAAAGSFLSLILGFIGGIFASETWWETVSPGRLTSLQTPWLLIRAPLSAVRAVHEIIWGLLFIAIFGLDPLTAVLAIAVPFGAIIAKVFSEILDETSKEPMNALLSAGAAPQTAFAYGLIPLAMRDLISYAFYRFECAIRAAAVLGIIGAGGLGTEIFLSLKTLKYGQIWTLLFALFLLNGIADFWSAMIRRRLSASPSCCRTDILDYSQPANIQPKGDRVIKVSLILGILLVLFSFLYIRPDFTRLVESNSLQQLSFLASSAFPPDFSQFSLSQWVSFSKTTLAMSIMAVFLAGLFSLFLSFISASNIMLPGSALSAGRDGFLKRFSSVGILVSARGLLLVFRSIPAPIWALLLLFVLFPGILPGAIALGLYTLGVLGRLMAEAIENLDEKPLSALKSSGSRTSQVILYGMLPVSIPRYLGYGFYRWEEAIRATVVVGLVGAGGLGWLLVEQLSSFDYAGLSATLILFIGIIFSVDFISSRARRAFRI